MLKTEQDLGENCVSIEQRLLRKNCDMPQGLNPHRVSQYLCYNVLVVETHKKQI